MDKYKELTAKGSEAYLDALANIGWFKLPHNTREVTAGHLERYDDTAHFVLALSHLSFDAEGFEDGDDYKAVLSDAASASGLNILSAGFEFQPHEEGDSIACVVTTPANTYEFTLEEISGWFDQDFIDLFINDGLLEGEGIESRFYDLPATDQSAHFVFMPPAMYGMAIDLGIIPEGLDYFISDAD